MTTFRDIPSIELLLQRPALCDAAGRHGRDAVAAAAREAAGELRTMLTSGDSDRNSPIDAGDWLESRALSRLNARTARSLRPVINATGVIIHTNLGRAPIAAAALDHARLAEGYSNLEYNLGDGHRGHRHVHAETLICSLTGAEAATVVNNNAAAALLSLAALATGREVIVSRGELVEIGGGFRVPEILAQSGTTLREVGTTNRTRVSDYAAAINDRTGLILRVHPSNYRIEGFTERPDLSDLSNLARRFALPLVEDLGSGWLGVADPHEALLDEPSVRDSLQRGADLVLFSGDKLLGGPQAGIIAGRRDLVERLRTHPLMRALRVDKITYAVLEATLALWAEPPARDQLPTYRMLTMPLTDIERRAQALAQQLGSIGGVRTSVINGMSTIGGGSAPGSTLPTRLVALEIDGLSPSQTDAALRTGAVAVVARIQDDRVVLDVRTIGGGADGRDLAELANAVQAIASRR